MPHLEVINHRLSDPVREHTGSLKTLGQNQTRQDSMLLFLVSKQIEEKSPASTEPSPWPFVPIGNLVPSL
jgi:hypothetical protein